MSRTAAESALPFDILKGPDATDHPALTNVGPKNFRIANTPSLIGFDVDDEVSRVIDDGVRRLSPPLDVIVEIVEPEWRDPIRIFEILWVAGRGIAYSSLLICDRNVQQQPTFLISPPEPLVVG